MNTASPATSTLSLPTEREIRLERIFAAPRDLVWRAFTDPELLRQWWGRGNRLDVERFELERGGHWRFVEHHDGGSDGFEGRFREVSPPERMVQTFEWDGMPGYTSIQTAEFEDLGDGRTRVTTTVAFFAPEERDGMLQSGMQQGLDQSYEHLDALLAGLR
ncbi:MAG TPA: SRPBCC family protein [Candidatus Limnocylindrales bacterium]